MATEGQTITARHDRRSLEAYISAPLGSSYMLTLYRQDVLRDGDGNVISAARDDRPIQRSADQLKALEVTIAGKKVTGAFVMSALEAFFDKLDQDEQAARVTAPAPAPAPQP